MFSRKEIWISLCRGFKIINYYYFILFYFLIGRILTDASLLVLAKLIYILFICCSSNMIMVIFCHYYILFGRNLSSYIHLNTEFFLTLPLFAIKFYTRAVEQIFSQVSLFTADTLTGAPGRPAVGHALEGCKIDLVPALIPNQQTEGWTVLDWDQLPKREHVTDRGAQVTLLLLL